MDTPDPDSVSLNQLRSGPIRNETLPSELLEQIQAVYRVIGRFIGTSLEQFEICFMRDENPADEVAIWCNITAAWVAYHKRFLRGETLDDEDEKRLVSALLSISTGVEDLDALPVPRDVGCQLFACYSNPRLTLE